MKKIFMFLTVAALTVAAGCSSDDDSGSSTPGGLLSVTIDGTAKTFNNVIVQQTNHPADGSIAAYTELFVTVSMGNTATEVISFRVDRGDIGADAIYDFKYVNGSAIVYDYGGLSSVVQTNGDDRNLTGSFSGELAETDTTCSGCPPIETANLTNGTFSIQY